MTYRSGRTLDQGGLRPFVIEDGSLYVPPARFISAKKAANDPRHDSPRAADVAMLTAFGFMASEIDAFERFGHPGFNVVVDYELSS